MRQSITDALTRVPDGKRAALLVLADAHGPRAVVAARIDDHWKVAAGGSAVWTGRRPDGYVAVEGSW
jgi:hypothetical protein